MSGRSFTVAGLFAGIGGMELGLERAGHHARFLCEIDSAARAVLSAQFPKLRQHDDIRSLDELPREIDLLTAGFPCQDLSQAGMTAGIDGARSGLIGEVFRLLRKRPVPWLLLENVPFMLHLAGGRALEVVVRSLEGLGYRWAYRVVNSLAFGRPQRRERVFLVASLDGDPRQVLFADDVGAPNQVPPHTSAAFGFYWTEGKRGLGAAVDALPTLKGGSTIGIPSPPAALLPDGRVVTPGIEDAERLQGFDAAWTAPAESAGRKSSRWKLVGNAVNVDVAAWLGDRFANPGSYDASWDSRLDPKSRWPHAAWCMGTERFVSEVSPWPAEHNREHLHEFLKHPSLLSAKATAGFWARLEKSSLRRPVWFDAALLKHLRLMMEAAPALRSRKSQGQAEYPSVYSHDDGQVGEASATC